MSPAPCVESESASRSPEWDFDLPRPADLAGAWGAPSGAPLDWRPAPADDRTGRLAGFDDEEEEEVFDDDDDLVPDVGDAPVVEEEDDEFDEEDFDDDFDDDFESYEYEEFQFEAPEVIPEKDDAELEKELKELEAPKSKSAPKEKGGDDEEEEAETEEEE